MNEEDPERDRAIQEEGGEEGEGEEEELIDKQRMSVGR